MKSSYNYLPYVTLIVISASQGTSNGTLNEVLLCTYSRQGLGGVRRKRPGGHPGDGWGLRRREPPRQDEL